MTGDRLSLRQAYRANLAAVYDRIASGEYGLSLEAHEYFIGFATSARIAFDTVGDAPAALVCQRAIDSLFADRTNFLCVLRLIDDLGS